MDKPRIFLADDHLLVCEGTSKLLEEQFELVGIAGNGLELLNRIEEAHPDVVVLDISMPVMNGFEAARKIRALYPEVKIIFLTIHRDPAYIAEALRAGAAGFISKREYSSELINAITEALAGRRYFSKGLPLVEVNEEENANGHLLTERQTEVLRLVAQGLSAKEIGKSLGVSPKTAEFHKGKIMEKLGLRTTAALTRYAVDMGLLDPE